MPTYEYRREDGSVFEIDQSIKDDALTVCPTTGQKVSRLISGGTGLIFKGTGFYLTDYARKNSALPEKSSSANGGEKPKSDAGTSDSSSTETPTKKAPTKTDS